MEERTGQESESDEGATPSDADSGASDDSSAADTPPAVPTDDNSALGDTDQHSDA